MATTVLKNEWRPVHARMLIGGEWTDSAQHIEVFSPARCDELVGTVPRGTPEDAERAIRAAATAQPGWASKTYTQRARIIAPVLEALARDIDQRAALFVRENGKTTAEARGELAGVPSRQRLTLELAPDLDQRREFDAPNGRSFAGYLPFGVVVSIVPWNAPISLAFLQIVPALLAGNTVVLKPPETCPLSLIRAIEMIAPLLPPGVINVVTGMPAEIGDMLTTHPDVNKVAFTGSVLAARKIMSNAAQTIKGITLELGGNDAAILLDDADLGEAAMERMAKAVYRMTGQVCMAIKRIYVPESDSAQFPRCVHPCGRQNHSRGWAGPGRDYGPDAYRAGTRPGEMPRRRCGKARCKSARRRSDFRQCSIRARPFYAADRCQGDCGRCAADGRGAVLSGSARLDISGY